MNHKLFHACAGLALAAAACGGSTPSSSGTSAGSGTAGTVSVSDSKLGKILVDGSGRSLYLFEADKGTASTCYDACATLWLPLLTTAAPTAGSGAQAGLLGTTTRKDGGIEVTYHGHPLYYWAGDKKPGDVTGQGLDNYGGAWYVVDAGGNKVDNS
ncbi:MAG TPA: hypothetical protein VKI45_10215 [Allosphingosinicella sp.]|nr:hypothetical protein [Allosphingosinicella sp.]